MRVEGATRRRPRVRPELGRGEVDEESRRLVAAESWKIGVIAAVGVVVGLVVVGAQARSNMFWTGDAPFFVAAAHHPFGTTMPGDPLAYGVAYRYGRILFPLSGWLLAFGRVRAVNTALLGVYVVSFGAWVAFAAEHLRRIGRRPGLALWILALPFSVLAFFRPEVVSDPMAGALVLLVFLYERDGRRRAVLVTSALLILTREPMALALLPIAWMAWKARGRAAAREWMLVGLPYALWVVWVRVRVGEFPFLDPSRSRREALGAPFAGWSHVARGADASQIAGLVFAVATVFVAVFVGIRHESRSPLTLGALALCAIIPFLGVGVYVHPIEAFRVLAPIQAVLLVSLLDRRAPANREDVQLAR